MTFTDSVTTWEPSGAVWKRYGAHGDHGNLAAVEAVGAVPYVPFKSNSKSA